MAAAPTSLRERLQIDAQSQTIDGAGQITTTWSTLATVWGKMEPTRSMQATVAGRDEQSRLYDATIRYRADVTTNCRVVWRGRLFDIQGVVDKTLQRQYLSLALREKLG
jgi:SPP1 family predicted phage head-tail adaptor